MNNFRIIFVGFLLTFASRWFGLVIIRTFHYGVQKAELPKHPPSAERDLFLQGEQVYAANGCVLCHTQQVRSMSFGSDVDRGWGKRRTVAADYLGDAKAMMGTMRTGPDLANIGVRMPSESWHFQHLYDPISVSPGSNMPPYPFLFERKHVIDGKPDSDAVALDADGGRVDADGFQRVPSTDARALVAYLISLKRSQSERLEAIEAPLKNNR